MEPALLNSTYKSYKYDTSIFVKWITETARGCGYQSPGSSGVTDATEVPAETAPAKAPRLKGKARKEAKKASNSQSNATASTPSGPRHLVSIKELLPQATAILEFKNPPAKVPSDIIRAGLRAISARKRCGAYYRSRISNGEQETSKLNNTHSHFITVMEEVLLTLQPCFAVSAGISADEPHAFNFESLKNRFAALEVEDPIESEFSHTHTSAEAPSIRTYELAPPKTDEQIQEEKLFVIFCLFNDLDNLRKFIGELWKGYRDGKIDLITASATTNTGLQLAARIQDEIFAAYPEYSDYQKVLHTLLGLNRPTEPGETGEIEMDEDLAEWIYTPAYSVLDDFCEVLHPQEIPLMKRGAFGIYNPRTNRSGMHTLEKQREDHILLMEIMPEFCYLARYKMELMATDEITKELKKMVLTKEISVLLAFAATIFLDIHHILRERADTPFHELFLVAKEACSNISRHLLLAMGLPYPSSWNRSNDLIFAHFAKEIEHSILKDAILPRKEKHYMEAMDLYSKSLENFYLYKRHPLLCGLLKFRISLDMEYLGVSLCNGWGTAIFPAHFYNALRVKQNPVERWPLMDQVIDIHTEERVFVGGRPKELTECFKQVTLTLGYSAANFAKNRRSPNPLASKKGPRGLKDASEICELFRQGFAEGGTDPFSTHMIEELLNQEALTAAIASNPENQRQNKALRRDWDKMHRLTSIQFLRALKAFLPTQLVKMKVDYFHLHRQSIKLLRKLRTDMDQDLRDYFKGNYLENESQLPYVGLYVMMAASHTYKRIERLGIGSGSKLLEKAGEVFEEFLEAQNTEF